MISILRRERQKGQKDHPQVNLRSEANLGYMTPWLSPPTMQPPLKEAEILNPGQGLECCEEHLRSSCSGSIDETSLHSGKSMGVFPVYMQAAAARCAQELGPGQGQSHPFY